MEAWLSIYDASDAQPAWEDDLCQWVPIFFGQPMAGLTDLESVQVLQERQMIETVGKESG